MIESITTKQLEERLGFTEGGRNVIRRNMLFSAYQIGNRYRYPLKKIESYEKNILRKLTDKYKRKGIDFKFDPKKLHPFLIPAVKVREMWNISHSTQRLWVSEEGTARYPTTTTIGKTRYFIRAEVDFIERGLAGKWRVRKSVHAQEERIYAPSDL